LRIIVTGATGFVGLHLVGALLRHGHQVTAIVRDLKRAEDLTWFSDVSFVQSDLHVNYLPVIEAAKSADALIHLAWPGLPNYQSYFHIFHNLPADFQFVKAVIEAGVSQIAITGTCLEYGLKSGALTEDMDTHPTTPYGFAKDSLRKSLQFLQREYSFNLQWIRLFYTYGDGQNPNSLLPQLDAAIDKKRSSFDMSVGTQLRDYLPIEAIAENICILLGHPNINGVINCSSGLPISVLDLVRRRCLERGSSIHLNTGHYSLPDYEPFKFWGVPTKLNSISSSSSI
jgi:nucleoside-diphosphate-sugar epimerase